MLLSMIVVTTSWAPRQAFRAPGMKPQPAPPSAPAASARSIAIGNGIPAMVPTMAAQNPPISSCPLRADVEQPGLEADRHREAGEDQRRRGIEGVRDGLRASERALEHGAVGRERQPQVQRVARTDQPGDDDQDRPGQQPQQDGHDRDHELAGQRAAEAERCRVDVQGARAGDRGIGHADASACPVAMIRPTCSFSACSASRIATSRPRYITPMRSLSSRTSSSSAETRSTAVPASRLATIWLWMNSIEPTSIPRVGWSAMSRVRGAAELAGDDELLLVAAGQGVGRHRAGWRPDVELGDELRRPPADRPLVDAPRSASTARRGSR